MDSLVIEGGTRLRGSLKINGSKNASLPLMAGALLAGRGRGDGAAGCAEPVGHCASDGFAAGIGLRGGAAGGRDAED